MNENDYKHILVQKVLKKAFKEEILSSQTISSLTKADYNRLKKVLNKIKVERDGRGTSVDTTTIQAFFDKNAQGMYGKSLELFTRYCLNSNRKSFEDFKIEVNREIIALFSTPDISQIEDETNSESENENNDVQSDKNDTDYEGDEENEDNEEINDIPYQEPLPKQKNWYHVIIFSLIILISILLYFINTDFILLNILILVLPFSYIFSYFVFSKSDRTTDEPNITNFIKNKLHRELSNDRQRYLVEEARLLIIGDNNNAEAKRIKAEILTEFERPSIEIRAVDLRLKRNQTQEELKEILTLRLKNSNAVIVIRTKEIEQKVWLFDVIKNWAEKNSHSPCLIIDKTYKKKNSVGINKYNRFYHISSKSISYIPWRLLKRANDRALMWRQQATYNRMIAITSFLLFVSTIAAIYLNNKNIVAKQSDYIFRLYDELAEAERDIWILQDTSIKMNEIRDSLSLSIWFNDENFLHEVQKRENDKNEKFNNDMNSIVGCAANNPTNTIYWKKDLKDGDVVVYSNQNESKGYYNKAENNICFEEKIYNTCCSYKSIDHSPQKQILCFSYESSDCTVCLNYKGLEKFDLNSQKNRDKLRLFGVKVNRLKTELESLNLKLDYSLIK